MRLSDGQHWSRIDTYCEGIGIGCGNAAAASRNVVGYAGRRIICNVDRNHQLRIVAARGHCITALASNHLGNRRAVPWRSCWQCAWGQVGIQGVDNCKWVQSIRVAGGAISGKIAIVMDVNRKLGALLALLKVAVYVAGHALHHIDRDRVLYKIHAPAVVDAAAGIVNQLVEVHAPRAIGDGVFVNGRVWRRACIKSKGSGGSGVLHSARKREERAGRIRGCSAAGWSA